ncbi:MAG: RecX family transcriptional regulator [Synergistaceae bacterium]|nr:RecX family transcriptional regulator [Synergistaceae bacterium]
MNDLLTEQREKLFNYLLRRPSTKSQAYEFLKREKLSDSQINFLIREAKESGLIDDLAYSQLFIDGHLSWGNAKIFYELESRGVSSEIIDEALNYSQDEISRARDLAETWRISGLDDRKILTRLRSRGFSSRAVSAALD